MRAVAVFTEKAASKLPPHAAFPVELSGVPIHIGLIDVPLPAFDATRASGRDRVLINVKAFSCNYRDQSLLLATAGRPETGYYVIGSEFCGDVVEVGASVTQMSIGDRVIANAAYDGLCLRTFRSNARGVPTNHSSAEYVVIDQDRLVKIPSTMSYAQGAAFTIGAQTSYSMIRRAQLLKGQSVLVTAACSNTSIFLIAALRQVGVRVFAISRALCHEKRLRDLGVEAVFSIHDEIRLADTARRLGGFDRVFDPFFDVYFARVIDLVAPEGCYVSCGKYNQLHSSLGIALNIPPIDYAEAMGRVITNNIRVIGNCLGSREDLETAISDYLNGKWSIVIDSTVSGDPVEFLKRTYLAADRFGKVVYEY